MSDRGDRLRLRSEIEELGRDRIIKFVLRDGDPFVAFGLLDSLCLNTPESIELIASFIVLRGRGFPLEDLVAWKKSAHAFLKRLVGEAPEPEQVLAN
jgi:hypothetical protein